MSSAPDGLDPVIHAPVRLKVMVTLSALGAQDSLSFTRLQQLLDLTAGNLITHLRRLEEAGYVALHKSSGRGDRTASATTVQLTHAGRAAFDRYRASLQQLLGPPA